MHDRFKYWYLFKISDHDGPSFGTNGMCLFCPKFIDIRGILGMLFLLVYYDEKLVPVASEPFVGVLLVKLIALEIEKDEGKFSDETG